MYAIIVRLSTLQRRAPQAHSDNSIILIVHYQTASSMDGAFPPLTGLGLEIFVSV